MPHTSVDVCVVGGGSAGVAAAYSAARSGARVALIERYGFLGGMSTCAMIGTFCGFYDTGRAPRPIPTAFGWTVVRRLLAQGAAYRFPLGRTMLVHYGAEELKSIYDELMSEAGVALFLHSNFLHAETTDGRIRSVDIRTRGGTIQIRSRTFIDCSGDAELCWMAGAPTETSGDLSQAATAVFRMAGVDVGTALKMSRRELNERMQDDLSSGAWPLSRVSGGWYPTTNAGEVVVNMTRIRTNGIDPLDLTRAEQEGRRQIALYARWVRARVPGFENAFISACGVQLGLRETRRLIPYRRMEADDLRQGLCGGHDMGAGAWPFEIHDSSATRTQIEWLADGTVYQVPLSALTTPTLQNVLVAGRCMGASSEAHASTRVIATCFSVGEAVGALAAEGDRDGLFWNQSVIDELNAQRRAVAEPSQWPPDRTHTAGSS
jgi:FAD dependent oxidoreductase